MSCRRLRLRSCASVSDVTKKRLHTALRQSKERRSAALWLSKKTYPASPQGYYDPTLMMRAPPKAASFLLEHVPEQEGGSLRLPQRYSAPSHHSELPQPTVVTLPKASQPPVVCPLPWPSVLASVRVIAQPLSRRRRWASTKWAPKTLQRRLADALNPHNLGAVLRLLHRSRWLQGL